MCRGAGLLRAGLVLVCLSILTSTCLAQSENWMSKVWPKEYRGIWFGGPSCEEVVAHLIIGDTFAINGSFLPLNDGRYFFGLTDATGIQSVGPNQVVTRQRPINPATGKVEDLPVYNQVTGDVLTIEVGQFVQDQTKPKRVSTWRHCAAPLNKARSIKVYDVFYYDLDSLAENYLELLNKCEKGQKDCVNIIIKIFDANGDGKISSAEISKFIREVAKFSVLWNGEHSTSTPELYAAYFTLDSVRAPQAASLVFGPWISSIVMSNLDYDGNGVITPDELALTLRSGSSASAADFARAFEQSKEQLNGLMPALTGLSQLLGVGAATRR